MTATSPDIAEIVSELREVRGILDDRRGILDNRWPGPSALDTRAADALESLSTELERVKADLRALWGTDQSELRICEHCDAWMTFEESARVDDISLCPREAYGSLKFPNERCFEHRAWLVKEDRELARAAINASGRQEGTDRNVAGAAGLEPTTDGFGDHCSTS